MESFLATQYLNWSVFGIKAFNDNYLWAIVHTDSRQCCVVDPGCADSVQAFLNSTGYHLTGILVTHHHPDHVGGIAKLREQSEKEIPVFGPENPSISHLITNYSLKLGTIPAVGLAFNVMPVPGHTLDHLAYSIKFSNKTSNAPTWLFCGDTLFAGGCGRLFEGTAEQMHQSLQSLNKLPADTLVFCAHEYTESNLRFAVYQFPDDAMLAKRYEEVKELRNQGISTVPTLLETERTTNVFLKAADSNEFAALRKAKDEFR